MGGGKVAMDITLSFYTQDIRVLGIWTPPHWFRAGYAPDTAYGQLLQELPESVPNLNVLEIEQQCQVYTLPVCRLFPSWIHMRLKSRNPSKGRRSRSLTQLPRWNITVLYCWNEDLCGTNQSVHRGRNWRVTCMPRSPDFFIFQNMKTSEWLSFINAEWNGAF